MPKRTDIKKILLIGSGPIIIGQACEFDYSGAQACKALREEGYKVVLVNDRRDLEDQLSQTATLTSERVNVVSKRNQLRPQLGTDSSDLNMVMVHKFFEEQIRRSKALVKVYHADGSVPKFKPFEVVNDSQRILLLIDEAHQFVPSGKATLAKEALIRWTKEGRQPGLSLAVASQQPSAIDSEVITQCDVIVAQKLTNRADIQAINALSQDTWAANSRPSSAD